MAWRRFLVPIGLVLGTLALAEFAARILTWTPDRPELVSDGIGAQRYMFYPGGAGDLVPNQDGHWLIWHHRPYHVETNSLGLRTRDEPNAAAIRIVATGDSQTFGPYVANEDAWPGWLHAGLARIRRGDAPVQVFNAAVSGYTISDQLAWLRDKGIAFKPAWVLLAVFENDVTDLRKVLAGESTRPAGTGDQDSRLAKYWIKRVRKHLGENSAIYAFAARINMRSALSAAGVDLRRGEGAAARRPSEGQPDLEALQTRYAQTFQTFVNEARAAGIRVGVVAIPDTTSIESEVAGPVARFVGDLARQADVPFLDLHGDFMQVPDALEALYLLQWDPASGELRGNGHLSRHGHRVVGRRVTEWLQPLLKAGKP